MGEEFVCIGFQSIINYNALTIVWKPVRVSGKRGKTLAAKFPLNVTKKICPRPLNSEVLSRSATPESISMQCFRTRNQVPPYLWRIEHDVLGYVHDCLNYFLYVPIDDYYTLSNFRIK